MTYDATHKSHLTAEVKEDFVALIMEFAHTWTCGQLIVRHLTPLLSGKGYSFYKALL